MYICKDVEMCLRSVRARMRLTRQDICVDDFILVFVQCWKNAVMMNPPCASERNHLWGNLDLSFRKAHYNC